MSNITLVYLDVTTFYEGKIKEIDVIIKIIKRNLLELLSFLRCSCLSYVLCSRIGSSVGAFIMKEASSSVTKTTKILKIIFRFVRIFPQK